MIFKDLITFYTYFFFLFRDIYDILLLWHIVWQGSAVLPAGTGLMGCSVCVCVCVFSSRLSYFSFTAVLTQRQLSVTTGGVLA